MTHRAGVAILSLAVASLFVGCENAPPSAATTAGSTMAVQVTLKYDIEGMHCDGCVQAIIAKVTKLTGVVSCEVLLDARTATIVVSDAQIQGDVENAITKLGYKIVKQS